MNPGRKKIVLLVLVICLPILFTAALLVYRIFFVRPIRVPTGAMLNTILLGDQLLLNRAFGKLERGQIVLFRYPGASDQYISRIVGLPGEYIQFRGTSVSVNDRQLDEQRVTVEPETPSQQELHEISTEGNGPYRVFY